jgi:hypothetical protein
MDFFSDWVAILRGELAFAEYPVPGTVNGQEVCFRYFNYRKRSIDDRPRTVEASKEFAIPGGFEVAFAQLKEKMQSGVDLRPHLSRKLTDPDYVDPMLNDWGVHHFHLGTTLETDGFMTRTGPLLYARVFDDRILCLQILAHATC